MNPGRFFLPNMGINPMMRGNFLFPREIGFFGKIGNGLRTFNWSSLLNGANKTLNVVNQTIPLIRQAGPMVNNMRSMLQLAKAFGSETVSSKNIIKNNNGINKKNINNGIFNNSAYDTSNKKENNNSNYPIFFI